MQPLTRQNDKCFCGGAGRGHRRQGFIIWFNWDTANGGGVMMNRIGNSIE